MKIIDKEKHRPAANYRSRAFAPRRQLRSLLFKYALGFDQFKKRNRLRLVIDSERELVRLQSLNEMALFIKDHDVGLDELGVNPNNIVLIRLWLFRLALGGNRCRAQNQTRQDQETIG